MIRNWTHHIEGTGLHYWKVDEDDPDLATFNCGDTPYAEEMADFFRRRGWTGRLPEFPNATDCFQFGTADAVVGYAALIEQKKGFPRHGSSKKKLYLLIAQIAVAASFQRRSDPEGTTTYAREILAEIRRIAEARDCKGLHLNVRDGNAAAVACYEAAGFHPDPDFRYPSPNLPGNPRMLRYRLDF